MTSLYITNHVADRFNERIRKCDDAKREIESCLLSAKPTKIRRAMKGGIAYIPVGCCLLVCKGGAIVTVVRELSPEYKAEPKKYFCRECGDVLVTTQKFRFHMLLKHPSAHFDISSALIACNPNDVKINSDDARSPTS